VCPISRMEKSMPTSGSSASRASATSAGAIAASGIEAVSRTSAPSNPCARTARRCRPAPPGALARAHRLDKRSYVAPEGPCVGIGHVELFRCALRDPREVPGAAWSPTDRAACPQEGRQKYILGLVGTIARNRSSVGRGWPCGQDSHPKSECHLRRDLRHEAGGVGYWF
jgi:hypothetical protein